LNLLALQDKHNMQCRYIVGNYKNILYSLRETGQKSSP